MKTLNIRQLAAPQTVATDESGRVLMVEGNGGLNSTLIFRLIQPTTKDIYHMYIVDDLVWSFIVRLETILVICLFWEPHTRSLPRYHPCPYYSCEIVIAIGFMQIVTGFWFQDGHLFTLTEEPGKDKMEVYINVYTYK